MATLAIPTVYDAKKVLVADDEREHVQFLIDFLEAKGFEVVFAETASEALAAAERYRYRAYFIDLNIPLGEGSVKFESMNEVYSHYVGLYIIRSIRSQGNNGARIIAYSAHYNEQIVGEIERLYCRYIVKGRAKELKESFNDVLKNDPLVP